MELIETKSISGSAPTSVVFNSIPQTYNHLYLKISIRNNTNNYGGFWIALNGNTSGSQRYVKWNNTSVSQGDRSDLIDMAQWTYSNLTANAFSITEAWIPNYSLSSRSKFIAVDTMRLNQASTDNGIQQTGVLSAVTAPVTSITIQAGTDPIAVYSTLSLYGIKN
jgi:hypothetical protein